MIKIVLPIAIQMFLFVIAWRVMQHIRVSEPEKVLGDAALCFFFWWLVIPILGTLTLNEWTTEYVTSRRARAGQSAGKLHSGHDNGLYD